MHEGARAGPISEFTLRLFAGNYQISAMTSATSISSGASFTVTPEQIAGATTLKQLQSLLKSVDLCSSEHTTKKQALTALIHHVLKRAKHAECSVKNQSPEGSPSTSLSASPARSPQHTTFSTPRRHAAEPSVTDQQRRLTEHTRRLEEHGQKLEKLDRLCRRHNLNLYNLKEGTDDPLTEVWEIVDEDYRHNMCIDGPPERVGRGSPNHSRPRPLRVKFGTLQSKHLFLKHAKALRQAGFRVDDDLTWLQQHERKSLGDDFATLKAKGYTPIFRGSQLHYHHANKMHTCRNGKASKVPSAHEDDILAKSQATFDESFKACDETKLNFQEARLAAPQACARI